jgi:hypothetical protein
VVTVLDGGPFAAGTENGSDPQSFSASCTSSNGLGTVTAASGSSFPADAAGQVLLPVFHFHPSGVFVQDRSPAAIPQSPGSFAWVGFAMPSAAISGSDVISKSYRGFSYESTDFSQIHSHAVAFAQAANSGSTLVGGTFPNDDITQTPGTTYTISLGTESPTLNGVFPNARFIAGDIYGTCGLVAQNVPSVQAGFDANGNPICTAAGVGIVSQVGGKYLLYFTSNDGTPNPSSLASHAYVIQFYLYQQ